MEGTAEKLRAEKRLLQNDLANIAEYQFRHGLVLSGFEQDAIEKRRQRTLRRLSWINTEIWLVENAQPASPVC